MVAPYDIDYSFDLSRVFFSGEFFNTAIQIHGIRPNDPEGCLNIAFMKAARQDEGINGPNSAGQIPVGWLARPPVLSRFAMVQQDRSDGIMRQGLQAAISLKRYGLDETFCGKPAAVFRGLIAVELDQVKVAILCYFNYIRWVMIHEYTNPDNTLR